MFVTWFQTKYANVVRMNELDPRALAAAYPQLTPEELFDAIASRNGNIVCDIDDTLCITGRAWGEALAAAFDDPSLLDTAAIIRTYGAYQNVPSLQSPEANARMQALITSPDFYERLEPVAGAIDGLTRVHAHQTIGAYLTMRVKELLGPTRRWLAHHGCPAAPIVMAPEPTHITDRQSWKAKTLAGLYPAVSGIIDDDTFVVANMDATYHGSIFLLGSDASPRQDIRVVPCKTWQHVCDAIIRK